MKYIVVVVVTFVALVFLFCSMYIRPSLGAIKFPHINKYWIEDKTVLEGQYCCFVHTMSQSLDTHPVVSCPEMRPHLTDCCTLVVIGSFIEPCFTFCPGMGTYLC